MAPREYNVRKENLVRLRSAGISRLPPFNLFTCEWLNLMDLCFKLRSDAKSIFDGTPYLWTGKAQKYYIEVI